VMVNNGGDDPGVTRVRTGLSVSRRWLLDLARPFGNAVPARLAGVLASTVAQALGQS